MDITYLGQNGIKLTGRNLSLVADPPEAASKAKANTDALISSQPSEAVSKDIIAVDGPGEYEIKGCLITGIPARLSTDKEGERAAIYAIELDGIKVAYLGNIAPSLSDSQLEKLGQVDVLVLPVGGHGLTLDATAAAGIVSQVEPKYVVPTHFDDGQTKYAVPQDKVDLFLKEMGASGEPLAKLKLSPNDLPLETTVVVLEKS